LGDHHSASGSGSTPTPATPGPITVGAGSLVYGVTMSNAIVQATPPAGYNNLRTMSDASLWTDGESVVQNSAGSVNPQWTWQFSAQRPGTWLGTLLALNPIVSQPPPPHVTDNIGATNPTSKDVTVTVPNQPPVAGFTQSCNLLACNFTSTSSDPDGSIASYSWTFGDGATSATQNPSHSYGTGGTYT